MAARRNRSLIRRLHVRRDRGFTLVELMVAMMAGLLVSAAAFVLARNASAFFQREAGITSAQFGAMLGMNRLSGDIRRASFMATPNIQRDPFLCGSVAAGGAADLPDLAGVTIIDGGSVSEHSLDHNLSALNGFEPDQIILSGNFDTTEQFAVQAISPGVGGGFGILLQNDGAMARTRAAEAAGGVTIANLFRIGRFLRIVDQEGRFGIGVITGIQDTGTTLSISVAANPAIPTRNTNGACGCEGFCTGALVNPIARVKYDLRAVNPGTYPAYAGMYQKANMGDTTYHRGALTTDRTELVRVELDQNGVEINPSLEVVAEYAVDLKFGLVRDTGVNVATTVPQLQREAIDADNVYAVTAPPSAGGATAPETVRALRVRLATRAARSDRDTDLNLPNGTALRYDLGPGRGFVRLRTLVTDVALMNQQRTPGQP